MRHGGYGRAVIQALRLGDVAFAIAWLEASLTDAALDGCHHCGEREAGEPCRWCGLKTEAAEGNNEG